MVLRAATCYLLLLAGVAMGEDTGDRLSAVIRNVQANEPLYADVDIRFRETYRHPLPEGTSPPSEDAVLIIHTDRERSSHRIRQGIYFRSDDASEIVLHGGDKQNVSITSMYDGQQTRLLDSGLRVANVVNGREGTVVVNPHMWLFYELGIGCAGPVQLSTYLRGRSALEADTSCQWNEWFEVHVEYNGTEEQLGLQCELVSVTLQDESQNDLFRWEMALAVDRNYIPVRMAGFDYPFSSTIATHVGEVRDWVEVYPQVWHPKVVDNTGFNGGKIQADGVQEVAWTRRITFETVSLDPSYDVSHFRDFHIPDGFAVYHKEADSRIGEDVFTKSYKQGAPSDPTAPFRPPLGVWLGLGVVLAGIAGVVGALRWGRKK